MITPDQIVNFRQKYGISQNDFWGIFDLSGRTGTRYETGKFKIPKPLRMLIELLIEDKTHVAVDLLIKDRVTLRKYNKDPNQLNLNI